MYACRWKKSIPKVCIVGSEAEKPPLGTALPLAMSRSAWEEQTTSSAFGARKQEGKTHGVRRVVHLGERAGLPFYCTSSSHNVCSPLHTEYHTAQQNNRISIWVFSNKLQSLDDFRTNSKSNDHAERRSLTGQGLHRHQAPLGDFAWSIAGALCSSC
jgi:hypothetical protein